MSSAHRYSYTRSDGTVGRGWRAKWTGPDGRRSKRGFDRKADAEAYGRDREAEIRHGVLLEEATEGITLRDWSQQWLTTLHVRPQSRTSYEYALARILPALGSRPLAALRPSEIKSFRGSLTPRLAPSTADATMAVLAMTLRAAVLDGLIPTSPITPTRGGKASGRVVDPDELLTTAQVRAWGEAMPGCARWLPLIAATTGLRQGELLGLRLEQVDFLRRQLRVTEQLVSPPGAGLPSWGPPKTAAGVRTVPLAGVTVDALARHLAAFPPVAGEPIFRSVRGHRWRRGHFGEAWHTARDLAGLPSWAHWHGLRDVAASGWIRQGVDSRTLMVLMGHTSSEETFRVYGRLWSDAADTARDAMQALWTEAGPAAGATAGPLRQ